MRFCRFSFDEMLAAIATAVPLPNLSLILLAPWSQPSALREGITTLAPCSAKRSLEGAAMCDRDHDLPGGLIVDPLDGAAGAVVEVHEAFAAGCRLVDVGKPARADRTAGDELGAVHALPTAEVLFGEVRLPF